MSANHWNAWAIYATKTGYLHLFSTMATSRKEAISLWEIRTQEKWKVWYAAGLRAVKVKVTIPK